RRDVVGAQAYVKHLHKLERLVPERPGLGEAVGNRGGVVDEDVEASGLVLDSLEQRTHLVVVAMIADHSDTATAALRDLVGGGGDSAAERIVAGFGAAAGDIDGRARGAKRNRDSLADSQARTGYERDTIFQHLKLPPGGVRQCSRTSSADRGSSRRRDSSGPSRRPRCCRSRRG